MKYLVAIALSITIVNAFCQTCIVAVKSKNSIIVGAESRSSGYALNRATGERVELFSDTSCKIVSNDSINLAVSRYNGINNREVARGLIYKSGNLIEFENKFKFQCIQSVKKTIRQDDSIAAGYFEKEFKNHSGVCEAFVFGRIKDSLILHRIVLIVKYENRMGVLYWGDGIKNDTLATGETAEIDSLHLLNNRDTWQRGTLKGIKYLIDFAHEKHPNEVGGPINYIQVTRKKTKWIGKKPPCY